jgi:spore maturation protein SpmB
MRRAIAWGFALALLATLVLHVARSMSTLPADAIAKDVLSNWLLPILVASLVLYGFVAGVRVYDAAVEGAREALEVGVRIVPFLVVILVAVAMFRASGALDFLIAWIHPVTSLVGFPAEALPMALLRPLSGSGAFGVMSEALRTHGPDSFVGMLVSTLQGSTETTFYVLAVYFGAARVRNGRHCLAVCLLGDLAGFFAATASCHAFFG